MSFSLTATPEPSHSPPRVLLEATESDSAKPIQSCSFFRDGVALRFAANIAGDTAVTYDYDAPFDVAMEYRADAQESDTIVSDWTETWANLSAWTMAGGTGWTASAGKAVFSSAASSFSVSLTRASSGVLAKLTGVDPAVSDTGSSIANLDVSLLDASGITLATLTFSTSSSNSIRLTGTSGSPDLVTSTAPTTFDIVIAGSSITATGTGWELSAPFSGEATQVRLRAWGDHIFFPGTMSASIDDITVYKYPTDLLDVTASDTTSLTGITAAWLTNAASPDLALAIDDCSDADPDYYMTEETGRTTVSRSSSVALDIEGSADVRTVVTGPRKNKTSTLEVACKDFTALDALDALLANNAAVNLRFPATMSDLGIKDGFYDIGDVTETRVEATPRIRQQTVVQMPLTPSSGVSFDALWTWNYDALAQTGLTYDQAAALFPTYTDLLIGPTT